MPQEPNQDPSDDPRNRGEGGFNWRGMLLLLIAFLLFGLAIVGPMGKLGASGDKMEYFEFKELLQAGKIVADKKHPLVIASEEGRDRAEIRGYYEPNPAPEGTTTSTPAGGEVKEPSRFYTVVSMSFVRPELWRMLGMVEGGGAKLEEGASATVAPGSPTIPIAKTTKGELVNNYVSCEPVNNVWPSVLMTFLPLIFLLAILYFLFRHQMRMAGRGAMSFGKSKAKMMSMDKNKITFKNVAGVEEAKEEVWEIVEFLKDPKKFQRLGGRIPKGVLMVGPPGTGKTLLARAIAGEADVPFFSISGSDFVEMFVGVGASRVRDMFEQGKKNAPCIIFIDEIDAVGRHRGHGLGGGHDEREQTLNALLVEMDGFDTTEGVIIIAATNRPDVLDPALLRPGRFDRQITVNLPDVKGREEILKVHAKKVKLGNDVNVAVIARGTPGYSGAELANVINEAALLAARRNKKAVGMVELEEARDKVRWGRERRSLAISEKEKLTTAYHEAGHAILVEALEHTEPLHKVTIIPRGPSLGSTMWLPQEDKYNMRRNEILDNLVVAMGGRVAEEIVFGDVTSGASGDIKMATHSARKMVCEWGMSEELGMVEYGDNHEHVFLARDMSSGRNYSEATAQKIDREVKRLIDDAYAKATHVIVTNRTALDAIAKALLEYETLDGDHIREIMQHGRLLNPPASPQPPELPNDAEPPKEPHSERPEQEDDGYPGGLQGAPVGV